MSFASLNRPRVDLYPHKPQSLLPLLQDHLPHSLPVYSLIHSAQNSAESDHLDACNQLASDCSLSEAWATFPPTSSPPRLFVIIMHVPAPQTNQTRLFCSAELASASQVDKTAGLELVKGSVLAFRTVSSRMEVVGGLSTLWSEEVRSTLGTLSSKGIYNIWLAPITLSQAKNQPAKMDDLMVDVGRRQDCEQIQATREIAMPLEYYISRLPCTSVIRTITAPHSAVAWVLENSAGDIGSLYVVPQYRRRGLAKRVAREMMARQQAKQLRSHAWVLDGNEASESLWLSLGWEKGWSGEWVRW